MPGGTIKPGNRDFPVSSIYQELMDGVQLGQQGKQPRTGEKVWGDDHRFMYFIRPGTQITESNSYMFTHNMEVIDARAARIKSSSKEIK